MHVELTREIHPPSAPPDVDLDLPGSKSLSNRYLLLAALARGKSTLRRLLVADDSEAMLGCVRRLGATVELDATGTDARITGIDGIVPGSGEVFARQSGTTARFIAPVLALASGPWRLDADPQLRSRPMEDLFQALRRLGARVTAIGPIDDSLPVVIEGPIGALPVAISGAVSSQFLSGLLLAAPLLRDGLRIEVLGSLVSRPYVEMTLHAMRAFGAQVSERDGAYLVEGGGYRASDIAIEPDASAASYFFAAAALTNGRVRVLGIGPRSVQGDLRFIDLLEQMGAQIRRDDDAIEVTGTGHLHGIEVDLADASDLVPTLSVVASRADSPTRITGVGFIRNKESDRIGAVVTELRRCGVEAKEEPDGLVVAPSSVHGATVETYGDHRIAMAFALLGLVTTGVVIRDPSCVAKTFPQFFETLEMLGVDRD